MRFNDAILGIVLIGFAALAAVGTLEFPQVPGQDYGSALFPRILCAGFAIGGLLLILSGWRNRATQPLLDTDDWARSPGHLFTLALAVGGVLFYILVSDWLGFIPTAFLVAFTLMVRLRGRWISSFVIAAAVTAAIHQIFYGLLLVPLPWGVLESVVY